MTGYKSKRAAAQNKLVMTKDEQEIYERGFIDGMQHQMKSTVEKAVNAMIQPAQEPVAWRNAAIRVGEDLCSVGPFGYYDMTAKQWLDWALSVVTVHAPPPQRPWVGLTDDERRGLREWQKIQEELGPVWAPMMLYLYEAIEAKLKEKNT